MTEQTIDIDTLSAVVERLTRRILALEAKVPTDNEIDAMRALLRGDEWIFPDGKPGYRSADMVQSYLERQR